MLPGGVGRDFDPPAAYFWSAEAGWELVVEHTEDHPEETLARFGEPLVPSPAEVACFVGEVLAGRRRGGRPAAGAAADLRESLNGFAVLVLPPGNFRESDPDRPE